MAGTLAVMVLAACSSDHDPGEFGRQGSATTTTTTTVPSSSAPATADGSAVTTTTSGAATTTVIGATTTTTTVASTAGKVVGSAVAGAAGGVEPGGPPFAQTDPFAEAVRLADGSCTGWADSRGGSTAGLAVGSPVAVLDPTSSALLGTGSITASRWVDPSGGGNQWTCFFDFSADIPNAPAEVLIKVGDLQPWTARPDPADPTRKVASVSTDAAIGLIPSCPALPTPTTTVAPAPTATAEPTTAAPTTTAVLGAPVSGWNAVGTYWSVGVDALCKAGFAVTALARPCREPNQGSEYITEIADSNRAAVRYVNGAAIPAGTQLTVVVATGRPCD